MRGWWQDRRRQRDELRVLRGEQHERFLKMKEDELTIERMKVENRRFELEVRARKELGERGIDWDF